MKILDLIDLLQEVEKSHGSNVDVYSYSVNGYCGELTEIEIKEKLWSKGKSKSLLISATETRL